MKSPITGKDMVAMFEPRIINYKGKQVEIISYYWLDTDTGDKFEDEQFADHNYSQSINKL